jgi:hypothetical protein
MKESLTKVGIFAIGLTVVLVPTFLLMNIVDKTAKNESSANKIKNLLTIGGIIGGIILGSKQVKKYEIKKASNKSIK